MNVKEIAVVEKLENAMYGSGIVADTFFELESILDEKYLENHKVAVIDDNVIQVSKVRILEKLKKNYYREKGSLAFAFKLSSFGLDDEIKNGNDSFENYNIINIDFNEKKAEINYDFMHSFKPKQLIEPLNKELEIILSNNGFKTSSKYNGVDFNFIKINEKSLDYGSITKYADMINKLKAKFSEIKEVRDVTVGSSFEERLNDNGELVIVEKSNNFFVFYSLNSEIKGHGHVIMFNTESKTLNISNFELKSIEEDIKSIAKEYGFNVKE